MSRGVRAPRIGTAPGGAPVGPAGSRPSGRARLPRASGGARDSGPRTPPSERSAARPEAPAAGSGPPGRSPRSTERAGRTGGPRTGGPVRIRRGNRAGGPGAGLRSARAEGPAGGGSRRTGSPGPGPMRSELLRETGRRARRTRFPRERAVEAGSAGRTGQDGRYGVADATGRRAGSGEGTALPRAGRGRARRSGLRGPGRGSGATEARTPVRRGTGAGGAEPRGEVDVRGHDPEPVSAPVAGQPPPRTRPRTSRTGVDLAFPHHLAAGNHGWISRPRNAPATQHARHTLRGRCRPPVDTVGAALPASARAPPHDPLPPTDLTLRNPPPGGRLPQPAPAAAAAPRGPA